MVISHIFSFAFTLSMVTVLTTGQDFNCILKYCGSESFKCGTDNNCRAGIACIAKCGTDMKCLSTCLATYEDETFDIFIDCAINKHKCIVPAVDPHPITCRKPPTDTLAKNFTLSKMVGKWYVIYGLNPTYDCYNAAWSSFTQNGDSALYLTEHYDAPMVNGDIRHMSMRENLGYIDRAESPAILYMRSRDPGILREDEFRIVAADASWSYVVAYYCGSSSGIKYQGTIVYSRTPVMSSATQTALAADLTKHGWDIKDFCKPTPAK